MPHRTTWRRVLAVLSAAILVACIWQAAQLVSPPAPFAQRYLDATVAQNADVAKQLVATLIVAPSVLVVLLLLWPLTHANWIRTCVALALPLLFAGLVGLLLWASLPYGFGSGYEHASDLQKLHLVFALWSGGVLLFVGLVLLAASATLAILRSRRTPNSS